MSMAGDKRQSLLENMKEGGFQAGSPHRGGGGVKPAGVKKENQRQSHSFWKEVAEKGGVAFIFFPSP